MENSPLVSILIPAYNRERIIEMTVRSAQNQTYKNIEIIVGDNCSNDKTYEIVQRLCQEDKRITAFRNNENLGPVLNWKECFKKAKGEFTKILWSDDLIAPDFIEKTVKIMRENEDTAFVYTNIQGFDDNMNALWVGSGTLLNESTKIPKNEYFQMFFSGQAPVSPGCALFRTRDVIIEEAILNNMGLDHKKAGIGPDALVYLNAIKSYPYCYYLNEALSFFRFHRDSITVSTKPIILNRYYLTSYYYYIQNTKQYELYDVIIRNTLQAELGSFLPELKKLYGIPDDKLRNIHIQMN